VQTVEKANFALFPKENRLGKSVDKSPDFPPFVEKLASSLYSMADKLIPAYLANQFIGKSSFLFSAFFALFFLFSTV